MTNRTQLASGEILNGTILSVWLVQAADKPESVVVMWPRRPTPVSPPLLRLSGDGVPIGGECQHRASRNQGRQADVSPGSILRCP